MTEGPTPEQPIRQEDEVLLRGGIARVLKYMQRDMPYTDIRPFLKELHAQGDRSLDSEPFLMQDKKVQTNVLLAATFENIWSPMMAFVRSRRAEDLPRPDESFAHPTTADTLGEKMKKNPADGFGALSAYSKDIFQHFLEEWETNDRSRIHAELDATFAKGYRKTSETPGVLMTRGFDTALETVWGLLNTVRITYESTHGQAPTSDKFRALAIAAKPIASALATARLDVLVEMIRPIIQPEVDGFIIKPLVIEGLEISERNGLTRVDFSRATLAKILARGKDLLQTPGTTHCPALYIFGEDGEHMINQYWDWSMKLLEAYYIPTLEK